MKTIVAISTAPGSSAINIVRLSGDEAITIANKVFTANNLTSLESAVHSKMYLGKIALAQPQTCLAVCFFSPKSYTGENLVELHCHGGYQSAEDVFSACIKAGAVVADKGDFTKRAFLNGKLSLSDCEGIVDMINAESKSAFNASVQASTGALSKEIKRLLSNIQNTLAELEASLDYPEEMLDQALQNTSTCINSSTEDLDKILKTYSYGKLAKNGIKIAIVGLPNAGKSSLLNALIGKERAIVTDIPGTTRDLIEDKIEVDGMLLNFVDTAGIRKNTSKDSAGRIEQLGIDRALNSTTDADILLFVTENGYTLTEEELLILAELEPLNKPIVLIQNKSDLQIKASQNTAHHLPFTETIAVSAKLKLGINKIFDYIISFAKQGKTDTSSVILTSSRHFDALTRAQIALTRAKDNYGKLPEEYIIEDLRDAYFALGEITGDAVTENIIDTVFEKFCLGK